MISRQESTRPSGPTEPAGAPPPSDAIPGPTRAGKSGGLLKSVVQAERLIQLALVLPAATLIGWAVGLGLDHWLGLHWISIAGLLLGAVAGFVEVFRVVAALAKAP